MEIGIVRPVAIEEEMQTSYLDYAMSVIVARALPDVRDGLKPVHRRILYAMTELGLRPTAPYKKSARIVGEVLGKYHPHGDAAVYEAMVRMAQNFAMRYPLVDGQGNFGSIDADRPAAMRYTEARLTPLAEEMLADIDKNTVDSAPNFDATLQEPLVLPAKVPNLLVNGSSGIAVGMATNIPPHNLSEVCDALVYILDRLRGPLEKGVPFELVWARFQNAPVDSAPAGVAAKLLPPPLRQEVQARAARLARRPTEEALGQALLEVIDEQVDFAPEELMRYIQGPDFPTAGLALGLEGIKSAYATGRGRIVMRARAHVEEARAGRSQIVVTELPYQVNKAALIEKIAELVRDRRIEGLADLRDESDRQGLRIVMELKREVQPSQVLNQLYKHTAMQTAFSVNMLALVEGQPRVLTLKMVLQQYISYRREVVTRRTRFELEHAQQRAHVLEGLKVALENLDEVIATIRRARDSEAARAALMKNFRLTQIQAQAILDTQLRRLAALERKKVLDELETVRKLIRQLEELLAHPAKILGAIKDELLELKTKYGDGRRTLILDKEPEEFREEDLIPDQEVVVAISRRGYVRRLPRESYLPLRPRGVRGVAGALSREKDPVLHLLVARTHDSVLFFTDRGRVYQVKAHELPDTSRQPRGLPLTNLVHIDPQETVTAALALRGPDAGGYFVMATRQGEVKRVAVSEFAAVRASGLTAMDLEGGDELAWVRQTDGQQEIVLVTQKGQALRFAEREVRPSARASGGVRGVRLGPQDRVAGMDLVRPQGELLVITHKGYGKRTALAEYPLQGRGGGGVQAARVTARTGPLVAARVVQVPDELWILSAEGRLLHTTAESVLKLRRSAAGAVGMKLGPHDAVVALARLNGYEEEEKAAAPQPPAETAPAQRATPKHKATTPASKAPAPPKRQESAMKRAPPPALPTEAPPAKPKQTVAKETPKAAATAKPSQGPAPAKARGKGRAAEAVPKGAKKTPPVAPSPKAAPRPAEKPETPAPAAPTAVQRLAAGLGEAARARGATVARPSSGEKGRTGTNTQKPPAKPGAERKR